MVRTKSRTIGAPVTDEEIRAGVVEAESIIHFLSGPEKNGAVLSANNGINSESLYRLKELLESADDDGRMTYNGGEPVWGICKKLRMYAGYLRDKGNPEFLLGDELDLLSPVEQEPGYHIPFAYSPKLNRAVRWLRSKL